MVKEEKYVGTNCEIKIRVGESAQENWDIINDAKHIKGGGNWVWIHLDKMPSPHVIVQANPNDKKQKVDAIKAIHYGAELCKNNSKSKNIPKVTIVWTLVKDIKKGNKPGEAILPSNSKCNYFVI